MKIMTSFRTIMLIIGTLLIAAMVYTTTIFTDYKMDPDLIVKDDGIISAEAKFEFVSVKSNNVDATIEKRVYQLPSGANVSYKDNKLSLNNLVKGDEIAFNISFSTKNENETSARYSLAISKTALKDSVEIYENDVLLTLVNGSYHSVFTNLSDSNLTKKITIRYIGENDSLEKSFSYYLKTFIVKNGHTSTITYDTNGGSYIQSTTQLVNSRIINPANPVKEGFNFGGWYFDQECKKSIPDYSYGSENITIYAKWNLGTYKINFNSKGGTSVKALSAKYGEVVTAPVAPTRNGYTFDGWYTEVDYTNKYTFTTMPSSTITLYAKWVKNN